MHIFVGMLLLGPVALKLASTGYRFARYYTRRPEYVEAGPPAPLMRVLVAPVLVLSTVTLFGTGVLLLASPQRGTVLGCTRRASSSGWAPAGSTCSRMRLRTVRELLRGAGRGGMLRAALVLAALAVGVGVAVATYHLAGPWLHGALAAHN